MKRNISNYDIELATKRTEYYNNLKEEYGYNLNQIGNNADWETESFNDIDIIVEKFIDDNIDFEKSINEN